MTIDQIRKIDTTGDNQINERELREAMKPEGFLSKEESLTKVGELLNNGEFNGLDGELLNSLEQSFYTLKGDILAKERITDEDRNILEIYKRILGGKCAEEIQEIDNFIIHQEELKKEDAEELAIFNSILQEIESEISSTPDDYIENLKALGIDTKKQFKWKNLQRDIKSLDDLEKIDEKNIADYVDIPDNIPSEIYEYIANNIKIILYKHLQLHPQWQTIRLKGGNATGMKIDDVLKNSNYLSAILHQIDIIEKKDINQQIIFCVNKLPNGDFLDLRLKKVLNSKKYKEEDILKKFFDKIPVHQSDKFFEACKKNPFINELKNNYTTYRLSENNSIKTDGDKYCFLDRGNKSKFEYFLNKGIKLSDSLSFDDLYNHTEDFYKKLDAFGIDTTIPLNVIIQFLNAQDDYYKKIKQASDVCEKEIKQTVNDYNPSYMPVGGSGSAGHAYLGGEIHASKVKFQSEKSKACAELEKEYVKVLLQKKQKPTGEIMGISGAGIALKFNKDPGRGTLEERADIIVRETFSEKLGDQREKFKYDLKNDRQAAFGSLMGMIGGIAGSAVAVIFTKNIWTTSAGFTAGLRLGNGIGQELWNSGEFLYEKISGNTINDGNNKVENFGQGFLKGVGALDQNYEYVGTAKFLSGLGFDYLSTVATFGLSSKFGGFLGKLEGVKFAGGALKFGMEELILENFFVDIPMNISQTGFETFTGIDNGITIGNTAIGNQHTKEGQGYKSGSLSDALRAMKDAAQENLSFENLSQTFFNTVIYGGFLEGGGAAIKKMKGYLPEGQVSHFAEKSAIAATAFAGLMNFMSSKNINFNKDGKCIDTSTNLEITKSDPRFKELCEHLNSINATKMGVIESFEAIMETQKQMVADPENKTGLLFRLGLISPTNIPLNILKKKKELVEKKLNEAKAKGDNNKVNQLQKLLDIYTDAEAKLGNDYFNGKSKKLFEGDEAQAHGNSEMMDDLLSEINEQNKSQKLEELRKQITEQYKQSTGEDLNLTDEQLLSILDAHEQNGKLGELTIGQLRQKVKVLSETITDPYIRRFLLEAGFCGQEGINNNYTLYIDKLAKELNLEQYEIEWIKTSIEGINKHPIENGVNLKELPIFEILNDNYGRIEDLLGYSTGPYMVSQFFRYYLVSNNQELGQLKYEKNKKLQDILSNFSEDIKIKCKNAGINIDEKLSTLRGDITLQEANQICSDKDIIKLAQVKEGIINKHALELAMNLKNWGYSNHEIELLFKYNNNEYMKITELIENIKNDLSHANLSINEVGRIIKSGEYSTEDNYIILRDYYGANFYDYLSNGAYRFEDLLNFYLIGGGKYSDHINMGDINHNISVAYGVRSLTHIGKWYYEMNTKEQSFLAKLIFESAYGNPSEEERRILGDYKGYGYEKINKTANDPNNEDSRILSQYLGKMPLEEDIEVVREDPIIGIAETINFSIDGETKTLHDILIEHGKCDESYLEQNSFIRDRFISTSAHKSGAFGNSPITWHFTVKKGVGATLLDVMGFNTEGEILLDKNCRITITKLDVSGGVAEIYATVEKFGESLTYY